MDFYKELLEDLEKQKEGMSEQISELLKDEKVRKFWSLIQQKGEIESQIKRVAEECESDKRR
ncbi:MAG: hypothetical protein R3Y13_04260 [bacterium]